LAICILAAVGSANAADAQPSSSELKDKSKQAQPEAGITVFIDPATGKIRQPTQAEIESLAGATRARTAVKQTGQPEQLNRIQGAGGGVGVKLGAESLSYVVVTKSPDGKLSMECVTGDKAAAKTVSGK